MLLSLAYCTTAVGKTIYVDDAATGANNGTSWNDAYTFLQDALADANSAEKPIEIRVAQGVYKPNQRMPQTPGVGDNTFALVSEVSVMGGYAGFDEPDPNARNWKFYKSILSGDLNDDDIVVNDPRDMLLVQFNRWDNAPVVVRVRDTDETAILDGFIVTGGCFRNSAVGVSVGGAGMLIDQANPTIANCTFAGNATSDIGGGLLIRGGSRPTLTNCTITENYAESGGGIYTTPSMNKYGYTSEGSHPILSYCTFDNNCATRLGGGMYNVRGNPMLTECTFSRNRVVGPYSMFTRGANTGVGGGMYSSRSSLVMANCVFSENSAGGGGGICSADDTSMALTNCTFIGNSASVKGGGLLNPQDCRLTLANCRFINNTVTGTGGGVWNGSTSATLVDCVFSGNHAYDGQIPNVSEIIPGSGGGMSAEGTPTLIRCTFRSNYATNGAGIIGGGELAECTFAGNSASEDGGAIHAIGEPIITNCTFSGNSANRGGGIFFTWGAKMTMANCTFAGNSASTGNALASDPHLPSLPGYFQLMNCILWDGEGAIFDPDPYALRSAITHSNIQGGWPGEGNTDIDPLLADPGYWADVNDPNVVLEPNDPNAVWVDGDYHLKSQTGRWEPVSESWVVDDVTSPCIDAGDPNMPVGDEPAPNGGIINMGAYGGTSQASKSYAGQIVYVQWLGHSTVKIWTENVVVYVDPERVPESLHDAHLVCVTHTHGDHYSPPDIAKVSNVQTQFIGPPDIVQRYGSGQTIAPGQTIDLDGIRVTAVPSYNTNKPNHPRSNNWVGFVIELASKRIYVAGDTDLINEMRALENIDVAFLPAGGTYTMNAVEAAEATELIKPGLAIPYHWGQNVGALSDAQTFVDRARSAALILAVNESISSDNWPVYSPLVAHWALDETEGDVAHDGAGDNDGTVHGGPIWWIDGRVGGALELDGSDDYVSVATVLDPAAGAFSVFAWIKGGAPGQAVVSQAGPAGEMWLGAEPHSGKLMSDLIPPPAGRSVTLPLVSESIVTDSAWHHVGLAWDGSLRRLYVDGTEVAADTGLVAPPKSSNGGLNIGVGADFNQNTFWAGLIDDVRVYWVVLTDEEIRELARR